MFLIFHIKCRVLKYRFLVYFHGPGGFRELREAYRNHFHRSWYLSDAVVTSYGQKPSWGDFFTEYGSIQNHVILICFCTPNAYQYVHWFIFYFLFITRHNWSTAENDTSTGPPGACEPIRTVKSAGASWLLDEALRMLMNSFKVDGLTRAKKGK